MCGWNQELRQGQEMIDSHITAHSVYVWHISFDVQLQIQSVTWRFRKQKWMSIDIYIIF